MYNKRATLYVPNRTKSLNEFKKVDQTYTFTQRVRVEKSLLLCELQTPKIALFINDWYPDQVFLIHVFLLQLSSGSIRFVLSFFHSFTNWTWSPSFFNDFRASRLKLLLRRPLLNTIRLFLLERIIMILGPTDGFSDLFSSTNWAWSPSVF